MDQEINFDVKTSLKEISSNLKIPFSVIDRKNLLYSKDISSHNGHYALNIKSYVIPEKMMESVSNEECEFAYSDCQDTFFDLANIVAEMFGFDGVMVDGKSSGWLKPVVENQGKFSFISVHEGDEIDLFNLIFQEKVWCFFEVMTKIKKEIEMIYQHSSSLKEVNEMLGKLIGE